MAKVKMPRVWLAEDWFSGANPRTTTIERVEIEDGKYGDDVILTFPDGVSYTIFGSQLTKVIKALGDDSDKWTGHKLQIAQTRGENGKWKRIVNVVQ